MSLSIDGRRQATEIRQLTGLRGVLALDVVVGHLSGASHVPFVGRVVFHNVAVDFFFALSGFVLGLTYAGEAKRLAVGRYLVARFARIYPLYLFALLLMLVLLLHWRGGAFDSEPAWRLAGEFVSQLLLLGALPVRATAGFWNTPAWSVSAEAFCYLAIFPALYAGTAKSRAGLAPLWVALALAAALCDFLFFRAYFNPAVLGTPSAALAYGCVWWVAVVRAGTMFVAGWLVFLAVRHGRVEARLLRAGADLIGAVCLAVVLFGGTGLVERQRLVLLAPLLIGCLCADGSVAARLLGLRPVVFLGRISYSLYLLHVPVLLMAFHCPWLTFGPLHLFFGTIVAAVVLASFTHATVEVPMRRLIRSLAPARPVVSPAAAAD